MKIVIKRITLLMPLLFIFTINVLAEQPVYPVKVSENGRHLI